ncbi:quinone oxidoreductase family protein [Rarobacter incanus]|uniref:NADPH2:quinone reductase n=1 Tax=Rarobacter incanus TaxID=153494 RepID=A0A542SMQ4_9MICO|nr:quinone oxidoreductase [Rarobacter incanus]TQK75527.1 NADPH2:quinone reductase [Rarobacter incanus]
MHTIEAIHAGGPEVLFPADRPRPTAAPGQLLVRVAYAGVNFIDTYRRAGLYPMAFPHIPGTEGAGVVESVGDGVDGFSTGDRVAWVDGGSSYAEYAVISADRAIRVPAEITLREAAAAALQGLTAHYLVTSTFPVGPGDDVLIHAGAGGVGLLATQMARLLGARTIITTTSTPKKAELSRQAGATNTLIYSEFEDIATDLPAAVRALTSGAGVQVVFDGVGLTTFDGSLASLATRGMMVLFGASSGPVPPFDLQRLNAGGSLYITRPSLWHYIETPAELARRACEVFTWIESGDLEIRIGDEFSLSRARQAHEALESRKTTGKVLLAVAPHLDGTYPS